MARSCRRVVGHQSGPTFSLCSKENTISLFYFPNKCLGQILSVLHLLSEKKIMMEIKMEGKTSFHSLHTKLAKNQTLGLHFGHVVGCSRDRTPQSCRTGASPFPSDTCCFRKFPPHTSAISPQARQQGCLRQEAAQPRITGLQDIITPIPKNRLVQCSRIFCK